MKQTNEKRYLVYYYTGVLSDIRNEAFKTGELIIFGNSIKILDIETNKEIIIKNIVSITREHYFFTLIVRIDTINEIIYIIGASKIFKISNNPRKQIGNNIITNSIYKEIINNTKNGFQG